MNDDKLEMFVQRYADNETPWDTGIVPPEIVDVVNELPHGRALDLGCGTGTVMRYLLQHGWEVDGIDFVPKAIETAQLRLAEFSSERFSAFCHDVTRLDQCANLRQPYDLVIDIGCGHGVDADKRAKYVRDVAEILKLDGVCILYALQPAEENDVGLSPDDVQRLYTPYYDIVWQSLNDDTSIGKPSGWYRLKRK